MSNFLSALFMLVLRDIQSSIKDSQGLLAALKNPQMANVLEKVHSHPQRDWNVDALAKVANLSRSAFSEKFSKYFQMGPAKYLNQLRVSNSIPLILDFERFIKEIAANVGFASSEVFVRNFTVEYAATPSEYRKKNVIEME